MKTRSQRPAYRFADYQPMAVFLLAAAIYFAMSYPLSLGVRTMEARMRIGR